MRVLLLDTETTGLGDADEPIELAFVHFEVDDKGAPVGEISRYVGRREPRVAISPRAQQMHGISIDHVRGADFDHAHIEDALGRSDVLVAHNAAFDARMLRALYPLVDQKPWRCTVRQWPWDAAKRKRLQDAAEACGIPYAAAHTASGDVEMLCGALLARTGKTERSKTYLARLLERESFDVSPKPKSQQRDVEPLVIHATLDVGGAPGPRGTPNDLPPPINRDFVLWLVLGGVIAVTALAWLALR